jgi:hypothetical protein
MDKSFPEMQGYNLEKNVIYRDNKSSIKMDLYGKSGSGKRT